MTMTIGMKLVKLPRNACAHPTKLGLFESLRTILSSIEAEPPSLTCDKTEAPFRPAPSGDARRNAARWCATTHASTSTMNQFGTFWTFTVSTCNVFTRHTTATNNIVKKQTKSVAMIQKLVNRKSDTDINLNQYTYSSVSIQIREQIHRLKSRNPAIYTYFV